MAKKIPSEIKNIKSKISNRRTLQVLMVEDSEDDALLVIRHLRKGGYDPVYERVQTAAAMKKSLKEKPWDIVLCDFSMPKFSAPAAMTLLKKLKKDIPIIIVSGTIGEEKAVACMRSGACDYIMKSNLTRLAPIIARELKEAKVRNKQKHTEEKLHREEQLFRILAEQSSDIIVLVNAEGKVVYENPAVEILLGLKPEERIGKNVFEMIHPDDLRDIRNSFVILFGDKNLTLNRKREVRLRHKDGSWRKFEIAASNLVNNNVIEAVIVNLRDITERKQTEEKIQESERKYKLISEKMTDIVWIADMKLNVTYITPSVYQVLGFTQEEAAKQTPEEKLTTDSLAYGMEILSKELAREEKGNDDPDRTVNIELEYYHRDGSTRWLETIISGIRNEPGILTGLHGVARNITKRKQVEDVLRQTEERYSTILDEMDDGYQESDLKGNYTFVNDAFSRILGYKKDEMVGTNFRQFSADKETVKKISHAYAEIFKTGISVKRNMEWDVIRKDGSRRTCEFYASLLRDSKGLPIGFRGIGRDVTDRKKAEDNLRSSEEKFLKAFRYNPSAMCISTLSEGRYIDVNNAYLNTFGYKREEIIGRTSSDINLWVDLAERKAMIQGLAETGKVNNIELRTRDKQGNIHWLLTSASLIKAGGESYLLTQSMDVTDRKRAEEALKAANKQLQDIIEFLPDATLIVDKDNKLIAWNRAIEEMTGIPKAAIIGQDYHQASIPFYGEVRPFLMDLVGMDDKDLADKYSNVRRVGSAVHAEVFTPALYHNRGAHVLAVASPLLDDAGNIIGLIESIRDVTGRKQAELQRESVLESLRQSEELYTKLVNSIPDVIVQTDLEGNVIFVNDKALHISGYSREEMIGRKLHSFVAPEYRGEVLKNKQLMLENKASSREYNLLAKDGRKIPFDINGDVLRNEEGIPYGFVNVCRDISERRRVAKELHEQEERLQSINQNLPGVIYQFYARDDGEYGFSYISEPLDEFSKKVVGDAPPNLDTFFESFFLRVCEEDRERLLLSIKKAVDTVSPWNFEGRVSESSGELIWFQGLSVPKRLDDRVIFNGILLNINERKLAEEKSRQSEEKFHKIFMTTPNAASLTRLRDGLLIDVNKSFVNIIGSTREEVIGRSVTEPPLNFWVDPSERDLMVAELKSGKDIVQGELKFRRHDGTERFGIYATRPINIDGEECLIFILQDVTERRQAEEKFRKIFMTSPDCIAITRLKDGLIIDGNQGFEEITGWNVQEVIGTKSTEAPMNFWVDLSARDFLVKEIKAGRDVLNREFEFRRKGGSIRNGIYSARPINIEGEDCLIFILQDLTERKVAEEKLRKSESNLKAAQTQAHIGSWIFGKDQTNFWSEEMYSIFEFDAELGPPSFDFFLNKIHPDDRAQIENSFKKSISEQKPLRNEYRIVLYDGRERFIEANGKPLFDDKGHMIQYIGTSQDITERKKAEAERKRAEEKFRKIFMTTPDLVGITRLKDGLITDVNRGFESISGWKREEAIGTKSSEPPLDFWVVAADRELMATDLKAGREIMHREIKFRRKDGSVGIGTYSARPMNIDGEESLIFVMQDVSDQKRMEKELVESHKMNLMSQIASGVAHEVRNPLHAIQAISEAMAIDVDEKSDYKDYLTHIKAQVARLSHLMNDLLELSKPVQPSQLSKVLLTEVAAIAMRNWLEAHPNLSQKVKVVNTLHSDDFVMIDTNKIQQVIINIMENAIQHSPENEEILLELDKTSENYFLMKVIDRGKGIELQEQSRVFEPFFTTRKSGTGLGLSICKHIIESHGGTIELVNNKNAQGCTALFTLPVYKSEVHE